MKQNILYLLIGTMFFTACKDDEKETPEPIKINTVPAF